MLLLLLLLNLAAAAECVLQLPSGIQQIEDEAFFGDTSLETVVLPEGAEQIGSRAFAQSTLRKIMLPSSIGFIADDAFVGISAMDVITEEGMYAYSWCVAHGYIIPVSGIRLCDTALSMYTEDRYPLSAEVLPVNARNRNVRWSSSAPSVASVDENGLVTAVAAGTADISAVSEEGGYTAVCPVTVAQRPKPGKAVIASAAADSFSSITLTWNAVEYATSYTIYRGTAFTRTAIGTVDGNTLSFTDQTCENSTSYSYYVSAVNGTGEGTKSSSKSVTTPSGQPTLTLSTTANVAAIDLSWTAVPGAAGYRIYRSTSSSTKFTVIGTVDAATTYHDSTAVAKTKYYYKVEAVSESGSVGKISGSKYATTPEGPVLVTGIVLEPSDIVITEGDSLAVNVTVTPSAAADPSIRWASSDPDILTIENNVITAYNPGTAVITASANDGSGITASAAVTVRERVVVSGILLDTAGAEISVGHTLQLNAAVLPENADNRNLLWASTDPDTAAVSSTGLVTMKKEGFAYITVSAADGSDVYDECLVEGIMTHVQSLTLDETELEMDPDETFSLDAAVLPADASDSSVTWTTSNEDVAYVSSSGRITACEKGTCVITASANDGSGIKACCRVMVTGKPSAPDGLTVIASDDYNEISIEWDSSPNAQGYYLYRAKGTNTSSGYKLINRFAGKTNTSWLDTGLDYDTKYYYKVSAYNAEGEGKLSASDYDRTPDPTPSKPDLTCEALSDSSILLYWDSIPGATGYRVYRSTSSTFSANKLIMTLNNGGAESWIDTGLQADTKYYYWIEAFNSNAAGDRCRDYATTEENEDLLTLTILPCSIVGDEGYTWSVPAKDISESNRFKTVKLNYTTYCGAQLSIPFSVEADTTKVTAMIIEMDSGVSYGINTDGERIYEDSPDQVRVSTTGFTASGAAKTGTLNLTVPMELSPGQYYMAVYAKNSSDQWICLQIGFNVVRKNSMLSSVAVTPQTVRPGDRIDVSLKYTYAKWLYVALQDSSGKRFEITDTNGKKYTVKNAGGNTVNALIYDYSDAGIPESEMFSSKARTLKTTIVIPSTLPAGSYTLITTAGVSYGAGTNEPDFQDRKTTAITVLDPGSGKVSVTGVSLSLSSLSLPKDASQSLAAQVSPSTASDQNVTWKSSSPSVASVNETGLVQAVSKGSAVITATTADGSYTASCQVRVTEAAGGFRPEVLCLNQEETSSFTVSGSIANTSSLVYTVNGNAPDGSELAAISGWAGNTVTGTSFSRTLTIDTTQSGAFHTPGTYTLKLWIRDNRGSALTATKAAEMKVIVTCANPAPSLSITSFSTSISNTGSDSMELRFTAANADRFTPMPLN